MAIAGTLFGVGVGPGDPDLITLKAAKILRAAHTVGYFRKRGAAGHALEIARPHFAPSTRELAFEYPITTEVPFGDKRYQDVIGAFYATVSETIRHLLAEGEDFILICEGDPFFYGSFLHIYERLRGHFPIVVVPGVTGISGCWSAAGMPIALGDDVLTVLPGTLAREELADRLSRTDAAAIMKVGCNLAKIRDAINMAGRLGDAIYVERGTMAKERIAPLASIEAETAPYFSIVLVPGRGGRRIS